ncbi:MAG: hypothetical protein M1823_004801 [Watsoniomyces obsoletus]|nr:MAG: hypothetical protein M1823_004801 [Watsoniomyces obsoletus]
MDEDMDSPRGTKRKADEAALPTPQLPRRIKPLDEDVVNKIAAGEIIVAPVNALKELTENSVDAGSTSIEIMVKEGGLKLLQITDNGHGINRDDLPILCERFTTSKLKAFEELTSIGTYGFRGEALASISHIAHLTVTTKTKDSNCAWRASYANGKLVPAKPGQSAEPRPTAGRGGTQITVEDLFYNVPTRRRAFSSPSDEYARVLDMVGRYAVHCSGVAFSVKKHGESTMAISIPTAAGTIDRIRHIHGSAVANELINIQVDDTRLGLKAKGWTSNANYHVKRTVLLLFINHRAVESLAIKKAIEQVYSPFLPKGGHPFTYLSLEIDPARVDVNVHPTKREVHFLHEDEIIERLCDEMRVQLGNVDTSRTFMTQTLLPGVKGGGPSTPVAAATGENGTSSTSRKKPYENNLVRTDAKMRKITSMLSTSRRKGTGVDYDKNQELMNDTPMGEADSYEQDPEKEHIVCRLASIKELRAEVRDDMHQDLTEMFAGHTFIGIVDEQKRIAAIQGGVKLFLVDYGLICNEFFYQLGLTDFGNFGTIRLNPPLNLRELLSIAADAEQELSSPDEETFDWSAAISKVESQLITRREMLQEYFSLHISPEGELLGIPLLIKGYIPPLAKLPRWLLRLGPYVNWTEEKACFETFLRELAAFYVPECISPEDVTVSSSDGGVRNEADAGTRERGDIAGTSSNNNPNKSMNGDGIDVDEEMMELVEGRPQNNDAFGTHGTDSRHNDDQQSQKQKEVQENSHEMAQRRHQIRDSLEHVLFPAFRARLLATKPLLGGVLEVANLKGLYRVFERC